MPRLAGSSPVSPVTVVNSQEIRLSGATRAEDIVNELPQAFALLNPSRELAVLTGPALAGVLIAVQGPGLMYAVDAGTQ